MVRALAIAAGVLLLGLPAAAQPNHLVLPSPTSHGATSYEAVTTQLASVARQLDANDQTGARVANFDAAWPTTPEEHVALGGYTVLLVSVVVSDPSELPLSRVYLRTPKGDQELARIDDHRSRVAPDSVLGRVIGTYRQDAFYLAPVQELLGSGELVLDYRANRQGFVVTGLPLRDPPEFLRSAPEPSGHAQPSAVSAMLNREYAGFDGPPN